jgi:ribonucleoside-triphosphate reductase (thioredoxin)
VSLTGVMDNALMSGRGDKEQLKTTLNVLREITVDVNAEFADAIGIPHSVAATCNKPSGTASQKVNSASGMHDRWGKFYIRRVRGSFNDPLVQFMKDKGFAWEPDVTAPEKTVVFSFPVRGPDVPNATYRNDRSALEQLDTWLIYKQNWTEHNPSITVYVKDSEWLEVGAWVYKNFDDICGVSFLPHTNHIYEQAPYSDITEEEYNELSAKLPKSIDWTQLSNYEKEDTTTNSQELACTGSGCDVL